MTFPTAARALRVVSIAYVGVALVWATAAWAPIDAPARLLFDLLAWPLDGSPDDFPPTARWGSAVGAGFLAGLALVTGLVVAPEIAHGNRRVVRGTVTALVAWFAVDSVGSVASGFPSNVAWNVPFLLGWLAPLLLAREGSAGREPSAPPAPG